MQKKRKNHDACQDALSTYDVFCKLDMEKGIANYSEILDRISIAADLDENVYVFPENTHYLEDETFCTYTCPCCGEEHLCGKWIRQSGDKYLALGICKTGQKFVLRAKKKKHGTEQRVRKLIYSYDDLGEYYEKMVQRSIEKEEKAKQYAAQLIEEA